MANTPSTSASDPLPALLRKLVQSPRRRDFKTVPMVLDRPEQWDAEALDAVIAYPGRHKQVWNNAERDGFWPTGIRNALNNQVFAFRHPDFLVVAANHGGAQFALYDQAMWDKYHLGGASRINTSLSASSGAVDASALQDPDGLLGPAGETIPTLQRRGVVFLACHNTVWGQAGMLLKKGVNPDRLSHAALAAELTNHLVEGVILTPGMVGTIPELQRAGFDYMT